MPEDRASDAAAIIESTLAGATPVKAVDLDDYLFIVSNPHDSADVLDLGHYADRPRRISGTYTVVDVSSFLAYFGRHVDPDDPPAVEVWADEAGRRVTAIFNPHEQYLPGWCDHRLTLVCNADPTWDEWTAMSGRWLPQMEFAELIEDRITDFVAPPGADMLELAQTFEAIKQVNFESSKLLASGERQLTYKENLEAKAGRRGQIEIPGEFKIAVRPFVGAEPYRVTARLRYRINDGDLRLAYKLDRPNDVQRAAFAGLVDEIRSSIPVAVFAGQPYV